MTSLKNLILSTLLISALSSCVNVSFEASMPKQSRVLEAFPEPYIGTYKSEGDSAGTLVITESGFTTPEFSGTIGENLDIKPYSDYIVVNTMQEGYWLVYLSKRSRTGEIEVFSIDVSEDEIFTALQEITNTEVLYDEQGELERIHIDPTDLEFKEMIDKNLFESLGVFTPVEK